MRAPFPLVMPGALHVPDPYCYRCFYRQEPTTCGMLCVERIDDFITHASSGSVACVLIEPISGVGGNIVPPPGYFAELRRFPVGTAAQRIAYSPDGTLIATTDGDGVRVNRVADGVLLATLRT